MKYAISDELMDLLFRIREYMDDRADADIEGPTSK